MKTLTYNDIKAFNPCYDPIKYIPEDWSGTLLDILNMESVSSKDKIWLATRKDVLDIRIIRQFALAVARSVESLTKDSRVKACNDATELFLKDQLSKNGLRIKRAAAYAAYSTAANADYASAAASRAAVYAAYAATPAPIYATDHATTGRNVDIVTAYAAVTAADPDSDEHRDKQVQILISLVSTKTNLEV